MVADTRPPFATYLLPSFTLPFRRRQSSSTSAHSDAFSSPGDTPPSLTYSPRSSVSTSPGTSPPAPTVLTSFDTYSVSQPYAYPASQKGLLHEALQLQNSKPDSPAAKQEKLQRTHPNTLKCSTCATDVAFAAQIVSKGFTGRHGRAYLVAPPPLPRILPPPPSRRPKGKGKGKSKEPSKGAELINTKVGRSVNRELLTGAHVVADVSCVICCTVLGWKYVDAKEVAQRYKIGKYILEMKRVVQGVGWEDGDTERHGEWNGNVLEAEYGHGNDSEWEADDADGDGDGDDEADNVVVFDEDDEDECEDLFAGVWDAEVVAKRRARRVGGRR